MTQQLFGSDQRKMNALLVVPWEDRGGVVTVVENLAQYLQSRGHGVYFFHPGRTIRLRNRTTQIGFPAVQLRLNMPFGPRPRSVLRTLAFPFLFAIGIVQLTWFIRKQRVQIVNVHYPSDCFSYFAICRFLLPIRLVTSVHGDDVFSRGKPKARYSWAFRFLIHASDLIVLPSDSYRSRFLKIFPRVSDRTTLIYNGVDPAQFVSPGHRFLANGKGRYILCIAALRDYKGIDVLLTAAKPLLNRDPSLNLVFAGEGPLRQELEELSLHLGIGDQTQFLGLQEAVEIARLLNGCEVLVLPSRAESFGIVVAEAMACRKPVVASRVGGIPEIIEHGKSGVLVEAENPEALTEGLERVLFDKDFSRTLADNGYSRVTERFRLSDNGDAYETAFRSLLSLEKPMARSAPRSSATG